jgi:hypothetical protein
MAWTKSTALHNGKLCSLSSWNLHDTMNYVFQNIAVASYHLANVHWLGRLDKPVGYYEQSDPSRQGRPQAEHILMNVCSQAVLSVNDRRPAQNSTCASPQCLPGSRLPRQRHKSLVLQISGRLLLCLHAALDHLHSNFQSGTDRDPTQHDNNKELSFGADMSKSWCTLWSLTVQMRGVERGGLHSRRGFHISVPVSLRG